MLGLRKTARLVAAAATVDVPVGTAAASEGTVRELDPVAAAAFGISVDGGTVTRKTAMRVPAIRRGRNLIAGTIGTLPLVGHREDPVTGDVSPVDRNSSTARLLRTLDPTTTPAYTLTWLVDDLMFYPCSWWRVRDREAVGGERIGYPVSVERLTRERVQVLANGRVLVDGKPEQDRNLIRFDSPDGGMLADDGAGPVIRLAVALMFAAQRQADDDWSGLVLRLAEGADELSTVPGSANDGTDRSQVDALLDTWELARQRRSTAYLNRAVDPEKISVGAADRQLKELSDWVSSELARLLNLPAGRIGAPQGTGMTYTNTESDRRDLVDTTLALYLTAIYQRLSMPDVTPTGTAVAWDLTGYLRGTTSELVTAGNAAVAGGLASRAEVRTQWLGLPANPAVTDAAPAAPDTTEQ